MAIIGCQYWQMQDCLSLPGQHPNNCLGEPVSCHSARGPHMQNFRGLWAGIAENPQAFLYLTYTPDRMFIYLLTILVKYFVMIRTLQLQISAPSTEGW